MQKVNKRKKWSRPNLIILARVKPEEGLLDWCKGGPGGPWGNLGGCEVMDEFGGCPGCDSTAAS